LYPTLRNIVDQVDAGLEACVQKSGFEVEAFISKVLLLAIEQSNCIAAIKAIDGP
jgi:hypothetical protein